MNLYANMNVNPVFLILPAAAGCATVRLEGLRHG